jgi:hypothetical protein
LPYKESVDRHALKRFVATTALLLHVQALFLDKVIKVSLFACGERAFNL